MNKISPSEVRKLAGLSAITLTDDEVSVLSEDVTTILAYVDQLQELDTDGIEPTYQLSSLTNIFRDDVVENGVDRKTLLSLAADTQDNHIKVPKVL